MRSRSLRTVATAAQVRWRRLPPRARLAAVLLVVLLSTCARLRPNVTDEPLPAPDWPQILPHLRTVDCREVAGWWTGDWVQHNGYYRPVTSCSFLLDYLLAGEGRPTWWRVHNVLLMGLVAVLLAGLTRAVTGSDVAGLVAGLVSTDPSVEYTLVDKVAPRTDILCALFLLTALLWMLRWARDGRLAALLAGLGAVALSVLSKEAGLLLVALVPLLLWAAGAPLRRPAVAGGACAALLAIYWLVRSHALGVPAWSMAMPVRDFAVRSRLFIVGRTMAPALWSLGYWAGFEPIHLLLGLTWCQLFRDLASLAQWPLVALYRPRLLAVGLAWKLMAVVPVSGYALIATHYLYIPGLGDGLLYGCMAGYLAGVVGRRLGLHEVPAEDAQ